ncbi:MAG: peroxiredoxin [Actinobacteria bacterium 13_1_20CM_3_71_11]|nr:MAG: peroxiredoxin [Actinobacteria bacterium 13_1_20CM_3_71_11]TML32342.1 MAG: OsmC family protein [Actinomycetota bacterium]
MPTRQSSAQWQGSLREGAGTMRLGSGAYEGPYSFASRFESGTGTNPEELIAAAHAGCYTMALSSNLGKAGHTPTSIETTASVHLEPPAGITRIELVTRAVVPDLDDATFQKIADETKDTCPVSKALSAVEITLTAQLG